MFGLGMGEILVLAVVALLVLGPEKLPDAAKSLSKGIRDFRRHTRELQDSIENDEEIGGAIRDFKSALRGDEIRPRRRPPGRRAGAPPDALGEGDGAAAGDEKPAGPVTHTAQAATPGSAEAEGGADREGEGTPERPEGPAHPPEPPVPVVTPAAAVARGEQAEPEPEPEPEASADKAHG